jgi:hypothetical protein
VRVRAEGVRLTKLHPQLPTDIFAGQDLVLFARYDGDGDGRVIVEGRTANGPVTWTERVRFPERERRNSFVARLWAAQRAGWLSAERRRNGSSAELDDELRELGTRYGIPTELSSYLVLEPGMQVPVAQQFGAPPPSVRGAVAGNAVTIGRGTEARAERRAVGDADAQMAAPAATAAPTRDQRFEMAKTAAAQRAVTTLSAADSASADFGGTGARRVGTRTFTLVDGAWTDLRYTKAMRTVRVKPYSTAYFALVERLDDLRAPLALMGADGKPGVIVAGRTVAIVIASDGVETLSARELTSVESSW